MSRRKNQPTQIAVGALSFSIAGAAPRVQIFPDGNFRSEDGRPEDAPHWQLTPEIAARVIAKAAARQNDSVIDYEHQTMRSATNGQPAPAAGKWNALGYEPGYGMWIEAPRWTERAQGYIDAGEYQYISAFFTYEIGSGQILDVLHAGITNFPALDGLDQLTRQAAATYLHTPHEEHPMDDQLIELLGLDKNADDAAILTAVTALNTQVQSKTTEVAALTAQVNTAQAAATAKPNPEPDPAKFVSVAVVEELKTQVAALTAGQQDRQVSELVDAGLADGRLLPAQQQWATDLGKSDVAALTNYLGAANPIAALTGQQSDGKTDDDTNTAALTDNQMAICSSMGVDPQEYAKTLVA